MAKSKNEYLIEILPHDKNAEQAVLGAVINNNSILDEISDLLSVEDFFSPGHQKIYEAILDLYDSQSPIDELTLNTRLRDKNHLENAGGSDYLIKIALSAPVPENASHYAKIVKQKRQLRDLVLTALDVAKVGQEGVADVDDFIIQATERFNLIEQNLFGVDDYEFLKSVLLKNLRKIETVSAHPKSVTGIPTGFVDLDELTGGLQKSELIILAARPSMGKTAFALNCAYYAAKSVKYPVLFFSLEMEKTQLSLRLLANESTLNTKKLARGDLIGEDWEKLHAGVVRLMDTKLAINDKSYITSSYIRQCVRDVIKKHGGVSLVVVDYLQLMQPAEKKQIREQEIADISRSLKAIAKDFQVPVIALSQLNRDLEKRVNKRPLMADLRESGSLEQDADVILFIYRDEVYNEDSEDQGIAEIIVAKNRNGEIGKVRLVFLKEYTTFMNLRRDEPGTY